MEQESWTEALAIDADGIRDIRASAEVPLLRWCDLRLIDGPVLRGQSGQRIKIPGDQKARDACVQAVREAWREHDPDGYRASRRRAGWMVFRLIFFWMPVIGLLHALVNVAIDLHDQGHSWPYIHETLKRLLPRILEQLPMIYLELIKALALATGSVTALMGLRWLGQRLRSRTKDRHGRDEKAEHQADSSSIRSAV